MSLRNQSGMSLIELIVAISIFVVVMLASSLLYTTVMQTYLKDKLTQDLQREGDAVLSHMSRNLKEATGLVTNSGSTLTVMIPAKSGFGTTRSYLINNGQLIYRNEALTPVDENLLPPGSSATALSYTTTLDGASLKAIRVSATLSKTRGNRTVTLPIATTVIMRPQ